MGRWVIGIDLGTTNSCVAVVKNGVPTVIPNRGGYKTTPSIVALTDKGKRLVGQLAKRQAVTNAEHTAYAVKRFIGRTWGSRQVQEAIPVLPYRIVEGPHDDVRVVLQNETFSLQEVSGFILAELKRVAEDNLGEEVAQAVVTVPAYFNDSQRQATRDAGRIAGLEVIRVINEPTAAALAYGQGKNLNRTVAVYDLGGGTFDISVLRIKGGSFEVLASSGDTLLGGEDFDGRVIDWLVMDFAKKHRINLKNDSMALQRLKDAAEKAKAEVSSVKETLISLPFIASGSDRQGIALEATLTRAHLEDLTEDLIAGTVSMCEQTLVEAELRPHDIEDVILVGGMTRMPMVQDAVSRFFGRPPGKGVHPDEVVALGAAIQADAIVRGKAEKLLHDVTPHSLGIMVAGRTFHRLLERNASIPTQAQHMFTTVRDDQTTVQIVVVQGEDENADKNDYLGVFTLTNLRRAPRGDVEIEVTFTIDADGIVKVSARDVETGQEQSIVVSGRSNLDEDEIARMARNSHDYTMAERASEDGERSRQSIEHAIEEAEALFPKALTVMAKQGLDWAILTKARTLVAEARDALSRKDDAGLRARARAIDETVSRFRAMIGE